MSVCEAYTNPFASACYLHERFNECTEAVHCKQKWRPSHRVNWNKNVGRYFLPCILISWNLVSISPILRYVYQINKISIQKAVNPKQILLSWQPFAISVQFCSNRRAEQTCLFVPLLKKYQCGNKKKRGGKNLQPLFFQRSKVGDFFHLASLKEERLEIFSTSLLCFHIGSLRWGPNKQLFFPRLLYFIKIEERWDIKGGKVEKYFQQIRIKVTNTLIWNK